MSRSSRAPHRVSLLIRNIPLDARPEEVRAKFERYGEIRDIYLPKDYYTNRPRGFGFIEYKDSRDAEDAMYHLDRSTFMGREISVVLSKESRKTPRDMIQRERNYGGGGGGGGGGGYRGGGGGGYGRDRDRGDRYHRDRSPRRYSRSPSPRGRGAGGRDRSYSRSASPGARPGRSYSRSRSPAPRRDSPPRGDDYEERGRSPAADRGRSVADDHAANGDGGRSPVDDRDRSPADDAPPADDY